MANNQIWIGESYFKLGTDVIHPDCKWGHGNYSGNYIAFVNLVFQRFYYARRCIKKFWRLSASLWRVSSARIAVGRPGRLHHAKGMWLLT
jgi:hypothetical protein